MPDLIPLFFGDLVLKQIVEIGAALPRVAAEEVKAVSVRNSSRPRPRFRLAIDELELLCLPSCCCARAAVDEPLITLVSLVIHGNVPVGPRIASLILSHIVQSAPLDLPIQLVDLVVNMRITRCLKYLMPLFSLWIELIQIVCPTIRISSSK